MSEGSDPTGGPPKLVSFVTVFTFCDSLNYYSSSIITSLSTEVLSCFTLLLGFKKELVWFIFDFFSYKFSFCLSSSIKGPKSKAYMKPSRVITSRQLWFWFLSEWPKILFAGKNLI